MVLNDYIGALKEVYTDQTLMDLMYRESVLLKHIGFEKDFLGKNFPLPTAYASPGNGGANFSTAQTNVNASKIVEFLVTRVHSYTLADIDRETMLASETDLGAFMKAAVHEIKGAVYDQVKGIAVNAFGTGFGSWGQIVAGGSVSGATITLADPVQARAFQVGDIVQATATDGALPRTGTATISSIDRVNGTLTTASGSAVWSTAITSLAAGDFIVRQANVVATAGTRTCLAGLPAWLPITAPSSGESFFGVDRSVDPVRLAGNRINGVGGSSLEEVFNAAAVQVAAEGGRPDLIVIGSKVWAQLENQLGSKIRYVGQDALDGQVGFPEVIVNGPAGVLRVVMDQFCPSNVAYILESDTWKFRSLRQAPHIFDFDGTDGQLLRITNLDQYEVRVGFYGNLMCDAPGHNGVIQLL